MNNKINAKLVADLALLARRYPVEDWDTIMEWLKDDTKRQELTILFDELAKVSKQVKHKRSYGKRQGISFLLEEVGSSDPRKAQLLRDFHLKLLSKEILPTLGSLRMFSEVAGLKNILQKKREQMVNEVIRQLSILSYGDLQKTLEQTSSRTTDFGRDYEHWVRLILGDR